MPLNIIQHQLGHANLGTTSIYLAVHARRADDVCQGRTAALINRTTRTSGTVTTLPLDPGEASASTPLAETIEACPIRS